jgi:serine protease Do
VKTLLAWLSLAAVAAASAADAAPAPAAAAEETPARLLEPQAFRAAVARVLPSVVTIETYGGVLMPERPAAQPPSPARRPRRTRGPRRITAIGNPGEGPTTGLVLSPDGILITSTYNFLRDPPVITVVLEDGSRHVAKLLGRDETRKICLLKIEGAADLPVPQVVPRADLRVGQWAISVGVGYGGDEPAMSVGIVSALERVSGRAVQTDANLSPANYGGPLVDLEGRVIGICVPLSPRGRGAAAGVEWYDSGLGFAIPLSGAEPLIERMKKGETIRAGRLGVRPALQGPPGSVVVEQVLDGSPAAKAGIKPKDAILAIGGEPVTDVFRLRVVLGRYTAGEEVTVRLKRGQEELSVKVVLDAGEDQVPEPTPFEIGRPDRRPDRPGGPGEPKE